MSLRVARQENQLGATEAIFCVPDPRLQRYIEGNYLGWCENVLRPVTMRETPRTIIPMIFNLGPEWRLSEAGQRPFYADSFLSGLSEHYTLVESTGQSSCMQVNFTPMGAVRLLGLPLLEIADRVIAIDDVLGAAGRDLIARLHDASHWPKRFVFLEHFFLARFVEDHATSREAIWAWENLRQYDGQVPIATLADELGWSHRRLIAVFRHEFGLTPKRAARVMRFARAVRCLESVPRPRWAEIAADCGYYDQAHLHRDFRQFAGVTPADYFAGRPPYYSIPGY
jgi:AraC-like DNA-binding protein